MPVKLASPVTISVFFPAYNDAGTIASLVIGAAQTLAEVAADYEIIVVDDASQDETPRVLEELKRFYPDRVRVIRHPKNRGYGGALQTGIAAARHDWIFYTDGDAQYNVRELELLAARIGPGVDVVNGYKIARSDPLYRKLIGILYNAFVKTAFQLRIRDVDCDFRLMRRSLVGELDLRSTSGTICVEMVKKLQDAGCRFDEVPVHHYHRSLGRSQFFRPRWLAKTLVDLLRLWPELMLTSRQRPAPSFTAAAPAPAPAEERVRSARP
jgi:glycosyltransferase involved in cell wall biosynthesis